MNYLNVEEKNVPDVQIITAKPSYCGWQCVNIFYQFHSLSGSLVITCSGVTEGYIGCDRTALEKKLALFKGT